MGGIPLNQIYHFPKDKQMLRLVIVPFAYEYSIQLRTEVSNNPDTIRWSTKCSELDLQETLEKVLRVSENLRKLPG